MITGNPKGNRKGMSHRAPEGSKVLMRASNQPFFPLPPVNLARQCRLPICGSAQLKVGTPNQHVGNGSCGYFPDIISLPDFCKEELYKLVGIVVPSFRPICTVHVIHFEKELLRQVIEHFSEQVMPEYL